MLDDFERKLLSVLYHSTRGHGILPEMKRLVKWTGQGPMQIQRTMQRLANEQYIVWDRNEPYKCVVIDHIPRKYKTIFIDPKLQW